jgi:hypothetical protein
MTDERDASTFYKTSGYFDPHMRYLEVYTSGKEILFSDFGDLNTTYCRGSIRIHKISTPT